MVHDYTPQLPEIFPDRDLKVEDEPHSYETTEGDGGAILEEREYTIDKAPINRVISVTGVTGGEAVEFTQGTDYELSPDKERIVWKDDPADRPDAGSTFYISYNSESIISRYIAAGEEEFESIDDELQSVIKSKFVDEATGKELDRLGSLFGIIGKRNGRGDKQYRIYLKSIVQSFVSRGTVNGIKLAISAAAGTPVDDIKIVEDFQQNGYDIIITPKSPVVGTVIEDVSQIADPSGIELGLVRFRFEPEEVGIADPVDITEGNQVSDGVTLDDAATVPSPTTASDSVLADDDAQLQPKGAELSETLFVDDSVTSDGSTFTTSDSLFSDDTVDVNDRAAGKARWEPQTQSFESTWNFFEWAEFLDLTRTLSDDLVVDDSASLRPKAATTSDTLFADDSSAYSTNAAGDEDVTIGDSAALRPKAATTSDTAFSDDSATLQAKAATTSDTASADDSVTYSTTTVSTFNVSDWDGGDDWA